MTPSELSNDQHVLAELEDLAKHDAIRESFEIRHKLKTIWYEDAVLTVDAYLSDYKVTGTRHRSLVRQLLMYTYGVSFRVYLIFQLAVSRFPYPKSNILANFHNPISNDKIIIDNY